MHNKSLAHKDKPLVQNKARKKKLDLQKARELALLGIEGHFLKVIVFNQLEIVAQNPRRRSGGSHLDPFWVTWKWGPKAFYKMASVLQGDHTRPLQYPLVHIIIYSSYWKLAPKIAAKNSQVVVNLFSMKLTSLGASRVAFSLAYHEVLLVLG